MCKLYKVAGYCAKQLAISLGVQHRWFAATISDRRFGPSTVLVVTETFNDLVLHHTGANRG